jgi:hypothetical protein
MKFETGIWRGMFSNAWMNRYLVLAMIAALVIISVAGDLGIASTSGIYVRILIWLYLALPAHHTALTGQSGLAKVNNRKFVLGFLGRAAALSIVGAIGFLPLISLVATLGKDAIVGIFVIVYLATELVVLSLFGTWLPAVVDDGDRGFGAAFRRGKRTFWFVFFRLLLCNGLLIFSAGVVLVLASEVSGYDKIWTSGTGFHPIAALGTTFATGLFVLHVVMLATVLSRAYLIAENRIGPSPAASRQPANGTAESKS